MSIRFTRAGAALALASILALAVGRESAAQNSAERGALPRFVSLRAEEVNLRTGPGVKYPIDWVLKRRHMPVEIVDTFEHWRKIRDIEGTEGWVHQSMLATRRYAIVTGEIRPLRRRPEADAPALARVEPGVIGNLIECKDQWCQIDAGGFRGWVMRTEIWGVYPRETVK